MLAVLMSCGPRVPPAPPPAPPLPADPDLDLASMENECDALIAALTAYKGCTNLEDDDRDSIDAWIERAQWDLAAGKKVEIEPNAQKQAAAACRKATNSVKAAHARCNNGKRPKSD